MAQGKQSPRQKMINLMYLVFIAMMAMQVDRQVLRSFEGITVTLNESSGLTNENNSTFYNQIAMKVKDDADYAPIQTKATEVKAQADKAYSLIEELKTKVMHEMEYTLPSLGATDEEETNYASLSNVDVITNMLFNGEEQAKPEAQQLKGAIDDYRTFLGTAYATSDRDKGRVEKIFSTSDIGRKTWLYDKFYGQPMVAGLANLTKIQADIRTEEGNLVRTLLSNKLQEKIELNAFKGIVLAPGIVKQGTKVPVTVALGAYDNNVKGVANLNVGTVQINGGTGTFDLNTSGTGTKTITGSISFNGKQYPIDPVTYTVVSETITETPSGAVISADKMNVVYRELDNPISATVNGADGAVSLTSSGGGTLSRSGSGWSFKPSSGSGTVTFTASAKTSSGKTVSGKKEFRIKPVPPARAHIANKTSLQIPANGLANQTVRVDWPDFLFDVKGNVTSFKVKVPGQPTAAVSGSKMSGAAGALSKAKKGDVVGIFDIKYTGTGGISGEASSVTIEVR